MCQNIKKIAIGSFSSILMYWFLIASSSSIFLSSSCNKALPPVDTIIKSTDSSLFFDYQPTTPGSEWHYASTSLLTGLVKYKIVCSDRDTTLSDSKIYRVYDGDQNTNEYHRKSDSFDYWTVVPGSSTKRPYLALKVNAKIGEEWTGAVNGSDTWTQKMIKKDFTYKLDSVEFKNVIQVHYTKSSSSSTSEGDLFIAAGIGLVHTTGFVEVKLIKAIIK